MTCRKTSVAGVVTLTLDSPETRNALSSDLLDALYAHLVELHDCSETRAVVMTGAGPTFCSGADLRGGGRRPGGAGLADVLLALWNLQVPTICRVNGAARGGGVGLVAACDFRIASSEVSLGFSEVRLGVVPAMISPLVLKRISPSVAVELFTTGRSFSAREAQRLGLLTQVAPGAELDAAVDALIAQLKLGGPNAVRASKALGRAAMSVIDAPLLSALSDLSQSYFASDEAIEGITARRDKRLPDWASSQGQNIQEG